MSGINPRNSRLDVFCPIWVVLASITVLKFAYVPQSLRATALTECLKQVVSVSVEQFARIGEVLFRVRKRRVDALERVVEKRDNAFLL